MNADPDWNDIDPGIVDAVRFMRARGFETTDSGDGITKIARGDDEALPYPHVFAVCDPAYMRAAADRLAWLPWESVDLRQPTVEAIYRPSDGVAVLVAMWESR